MEVFSDKLAIEGGKLIVETLSKLENGTATRTPQDDEKSSYAGKITIRIRANRFLQNRQLQ